MAVYELAAEARNVLTIEELTTYLAIIAGTAAFVWGVSEYLKRMRHDHRSKIEHRFTVLDDALELAKESANIRLAALENYNSGLSVMLKQMETNQERTDQQFGMLREERKSDMDALHERFAAVDRNFVQLIRGVKYITPDPPG